ncbi:hypothetical protein Tco_0487270 [Tanacetum coccineum]
MRSLGAVASMIHSMIKFPTANGTATMVTSEVTLRECRRNKEARGSTQEGRMTHPRIRASDPNETSTEKMCAPKEDSTKRKPPEEASKEDKPPLENVLISDDYPYEPITIGGNLSAECRLELIKTLCKHIDAFASGGYDRDTPLRDGTSLKTYPHIKPRVQKKKSLAPERRKVVKNEVEEWLRAGIEKRM